LQLNTLRFREDDAAMFYSSQLLVFHFQGRFKYPQIINFISLYEDVPFQTIQLFWYPHVAKPPNVVLSVKSVQGYDFLTLDHLDFVWQISVNGMIVETGKLEGERVTVWNGETDDTVPFKSRPLLTRS
jgi:hypothetical protein